MIREDRELCLLFFEKKRSESVPEKSQENEIRLYIQKSFYLIDNCAIIRKR